jgi:light-regulated signal transduction histidine kinase (bacteriophytochrome)
LKDEFHNKLDGIGPKCLTIIQSSSYNLKNQISSLLNHSRIGKEKNIKTINVNGLIEEIKVDLTSLLQLNNIEIKFDDLFEIPAHRIELKIIFINPITNTIKYKKKKEAPVIEIRALENKKEYTYTVKDNGIGLDMKYIDQIFEIFKRLHIDQRHPGTGIGLANCKKAVEFHKGTICVTSEIDKGSTFIFTIKK